MQYHWNLRTQPYRQKISPANREPMQRGEITLDPNARLDGCLRITIIAKTRVRILNFEIQDERDLTSRPRTPPGSLENPEARRCFRSWIHPHAYSSKQRCVLLPTQIHILHVGRHDFRGLHSQQGNRSMALCLRAVTIFIYTTCLTHITLEIGCVVNIVLPWRKYVLCESCARVAQVHLPRVS